MAEKAEARTFYTAHFRRAAAMARDYDLLVLDEMMSTLAHGVVDEAEVLAFLKSKPEGLEVVMTGRNPSPAMCDAADYITEMRKVKHPFDQGITARQGIEY